MDADDLCAWRRRWVYHRSAWRMGCSREKPGVDGGLGVSAGKLERPGRCVNTICPDLTATSIRGDERL